MSEERQDDITQPLQILVAEKLYAPEEIAGPVAVVLAGTSIGAIWRVGDRAQVKQLCAERMPGAEVEINDLGSWCIAPGYIDMHTHGFHGHDITTGTREDIMVMARELPRTGVTSFFPTIATTGKEETVTQIQRIAASAGRQEHESEAEILGIRLEVDSSATPKKGRSRACHSLP